MVTYTFSSGVNTDFSTELNQNYKDVDFKPLSNFDVTDNTTVSDTIAGTSSSYSTKRTLAIASNTVESYIIVRFNLRAKATGVNGATSDDWEGRINPYLQLTIDSVQKFEISGPQAELESVGTSSRWEEHREGLTRVGVYKYAPTAGEKSSGFTLDLDLRCAESHTGSGVTGTNGSTYNDYWEVWGI